MYKTAINKLAILQKIVDEHEKELEALEGMWITPTEGPGHVAPPPAVYVPKNPERE